MHHSANRMIGSEAIIIYMLFILSSHKFYLYKVSTVSFLRHELGVYHYYPCSAEIAGAVPFCFVSKLHGNCHQIEDQNWWSENQYIFQLRLWCYHIKDITYCWEEATCQFFIVTLHITPLYHISGGVEPLDGTFT